MSQLAATPAEPPQHAPARSRSTWVMNLLLGLAAILLLAGLGAGAIYWQIHFDHQQTLQDVQAELDRIAAAGEPITPEEMHRYHQGGPRSAEKAELWLAAISALPDIKEGSDEETALYDALGSRSPLSGDVLARAEALLLKVSEAMKRSEDAANMDGEARFYFEFEEGINARTAHDYKLRKLIRWIAVRNRVAVSRGDAAGAIESLHLILAAAEALDTEPALLSQALRNAMVKMLLPEIRYLLDNLELTDKQLADLQSWLASIDFKDCFRRGLIGERASAYHAFHYLIEDHPDKLFGTKVTRADGELRRPADFLYYLDEMREILLAVERPLPEAVQHVAQLDATVKKIAQSKSRSKRRELAGSAELLPATVPAVYGWAYAQSDRDSAVAAIAFRRYQLAHGKPPESLAALCPEFLASVPQDPFATTPSPLRLVVDDDRFAIYSVGENGTDDRALLGDPTSADDSGIVARLSLPSRKPMPAAQPTESN